MTRYEFVTQEYQKLANKEGDFYRVQQLEQQLASVHGALVSRLLRSACF